MVKVLIMLRDMRSGSGVASCIMNYYKYMQEPDIKVDFLLERWIDSPYRDLIKERNSQVYVLPHDTGKPNGENRRFVSRLLKQNPYDLVHVNTTGLNALRLLSQAKLNHVKRRIYHAHAPIALTSMKVRGRYFLYEKPSVLFANRFVACSESVGKSVFQNRKFFLLPNAFEIQKYIFDSDDRRRIREELNIEDCWVLGIVSRMSNEKNPFMVIDIFKEIKRKKKNAVLLWAGDGPLRGKIIEYAQRCGVEEACLLVGAKKDVWSYYSAMDAFCLPSIYEGLGLVYLEAQISGLPCFGSTGVPRDVDVTGKMHHLDLNMGAEQWAQEILEAESKDRNLNYSAGDALRNFDIQNACQKIITLYKKDVVE